MLPNPFKILYELLVFGVQAAFLYGLLLIIAIIAFIWLFAPLLGTNTVPTIEVVEQLENVSETVKFKSQGKDWVCERIEGCKTFPNAPKMEEYCPTCVWK